MAAGVDLGLILNGVAKFRHKVFEMWYAAGPKDLKTNNLAV